MTKLIRTKNEKFYIRFATKKDITLILEFIKSLAEYENLISEVSATKELLYKSIIVDKSCEVIIGEYNNEPCGFALFFHNYSTFLGKAGIYLEDLFINPNLRGKGLGKIMLSYLAKLACERDCGRLEWWCLDWNEPSVKFYKKIGAKPMDEWTVFRLDGETLKSFAEE